MRIGIVKEVKKGENRVAATPSGVEILKSYGHDVFVEKNAGTAGGFSNDAYEASGAIIRDDPGEIFSESEMIVSVKEPQPSEYQYLREDLIYFSYLHLAASTETTSMFISKKAVGIAYETIQNPDGSLPLLKPMSEVAGPMAVMQGAKYLEMAGGGHGVLLGGVPGVDPGTVVILGGGVVGANAAKTACGLGAKVYVVEILPERLRKLSDFLPENAFPVMSSPKTIRELLPRADVVIGAVLVPGSKTPTLVTRDMLSTMKKGSVIVDVSVDQGGCFETTVETRHDDPIYTIDGVVHYAVSNMPAGLPRTSVTALTNATLCYVLAIAEKGWKHAAREYPDIRKGINIACGEVVYEGVAKAQHTDYRDIMTLI